MLKWRVAALAIGKMLLVLAAIIGTVQVFRLLLLPQIQSAFHLGDPGTSAVRRIGILVAAILAYWATNRLIEKRTIVELRFAPRGIVLGALAGATVISITTLSLFAAGIYEMTEFRGLQSGLLGVAGLILVAAMLEEVVFRGVLFRMLENTWGTIPALWLSSLLFGLQHLANVEGANLVASVTTGISVMLIGAFWALIFVHTRNLWIVGANHAAWNFAIMLTGLPLSGLEDWRKLAPFESRYNGPDWLTGGAFGPETSALTISLMIVCLAVLFREARKRKQIIEV
ncbi:MAG TPA: type II CAAX endopeptidase family protein [Hyphomonas sp.]|nr:type II CAAX endopeptidase family protein [Hyphomonas sp.]HRX73089.1 type II CAAX endopeptidase family protein [Hyphomonas sp.]